MEALILLTAASCLLGVLLTPLVRDWSVRAGLVDRPDRVRKLHKPGTPRTGGVAIFLSYAAACTAVLFLPLDGTELLHTHLPQITRLLPPVTLIFFTGLVDDWLTLRPWQKLLGQVSTAVWAWGAGIRLYSAGGWETGPWVGFLLTVAWLVLCSNAFNLIDGVDGLAAGAGLTAALTMLAAGMLHGDFFLALAAAPLAGCLLGFLKHNFAPASIFLGDSGSLLVGFLLGCFGIVWSQKSPTVLGAAAPVMALALPLIEVALSIVRRFLRTEPIFAGDRGHIHHRLLDLGLSPRKVCLSLWAVCGIGALFSIPQSMTPNSSPVVLVLAFAAAAGVAIHYLGYVEFAAVLRCFAGIRSTLRAQIHLEIMERSLAGAANIGECWLAMERAADALGFGPMTARLAGRTFSTGFEPGGHETLWRMRLNLPGTGWVDIVRKECPDAPPAPVGAFAGLLRRLLPAKLAQLGQPPVVPVELAAESLAALAAAVEASGAYEPQNSRTRTVTSSDCGAPSVNAATAS